MNPEIESFYRKTSPWRTLDHKLTPIFNHIRTKHIHCLHQLQADPTNSPFSFTPTSNFILPVFHKKAESHRQQVADHKKPQKRSPANRVKVVERRQYRSIQVGTSSEKVKFVGPSSKIKKHLIDNIDYQGIENALFKKQDRVSRFEDFCRTLRQKELWKTPLSSSNSQYEDNSFRDTTIDIGVRETRNPFRVTRKQFSPVAKRLEQILKNQPLSQQSNY